MIHIIVSFIVGIIINKIVIEPIERQYYRKKYFEKSKSNLMKKYKNEEENK